MINLLTKRSEAEQMLNRSNASINHLSPQHATALELSSAIGVGGLLDRSRCATGNEYSRIYQCTVPYCTVYISILYRYTYCTDS